MRTTTVSHALATALLFVVGCGSSTEPQPSPAEATQPDAGPVDTGTHAPPVRTMTTRSLLPGAPQNMLLDWSFRDVGWGKFLGLYDGFSAQYVAQSRTFSLSPAGVTAAVAIFEDNLATDEKSRGITAVAPFVGGKGPFRARGWVSKSTAAGAPAELVDDRLVFRASITTGGIPEGKAYDLARVSQQTIGDRVWHLFEATIDQDLETGFFNLRFGRKGGGFMVQAPEIVPVGLLPSGDSTLSLRVSALPRAVDADELAAARAYARQPIQLGLPPQPKVVPGKPSFVLP